MSAALKERPPSSGRHRSAPEKSGSSAENRVHMSFPDSMKDRLEEVKTEAGMGSLSEVFRLAVKVFLILYEEHRNGSELLLRNRNGEIEKLRLFY